MALPRPLSAEFPRAVEGSSVAVLAYRTHDGTPRAVPVTPLLDGGQVIVTSTLALLGKVAALRRDPRVSLRVGGWELRGNVEIEFDLDGAAFAARLRTQELRKFPPSRALLGFPGHRRLLWWYAGRVWLRLQPVALLAPIPAARQDNDRVTCSTIGEDGFPRIARLDLSLEAVRSALPGQVVDLGAGSPALPTDPPRGACLLAHEENASFTDLRQMRLSGELRGHELRITSRRGSLEPRPGGALVQLAELRDLARRARANRARLRRWAVGTARIAPAGAPCRNQLPLHLSFWMPGLGQLWRCEWIKGGALLGASLPASGFMIDAATEFAASNGSLTRLVVWSAISIVIWVWAVHDARLSEGKPRWPCRRGAEP